MGAEIVGVERRLLELLVHLRGVLVGMGRGRHSVVTGTYLDKLGFGSNVDCIVSIVQANSSNTLYVKLHLCTMALFNC